MPKRNCRAANASAAVVEFAMADTDDDLPPPPTKPVARVELPDTDDDLPPPPAVAKAPVVLPDTDDEDDLPPPPKPVAKAVVLPDSDDDLPPPPKPKATTSDELPEPPAPSVGDAPGSTRTRSRHVNADTTAKRPRRATTAVRSVNDMALEGFLFKQAPTWPHTSQKRWCALKGRVLSYYEAQGVSAAAGTLDLRGAVLVDVSKTAKMPHSFGLTGPNGQLKSRTYIFSAVSREEYEKWVATIQAVTAEPKVSELHWFDKMAQAIF